VTDEGANHLAEAVRTNQSLLNLDLQMNEIGDVGAHALSTALQGQSGHAGAGGEYERCVVYLGGNRLSRECKDELQQQCSAFLHT
jgi:hypothetical protein